MNNTEYWDDSEEELRQLITRLLSEQEERIIKEVENPLWIDVGERFWEEEIRTFTNELAPHFIDKFLGAATWILNDLLGKKKQLEFLWELFELINEKAAEWARRFTFDFVGRIMGTTRQMVEDALMRYITEPEYQLKDFMEEIDRGMGDWRAENIAVTETTRAFAQAADEMDREFEAAGLEFYRFWNTRNDSLVCDICGPLHGLPETAEGGWDPTGIGPGAYPPAHPHCRCWITRSMFLD